MKYEEKLQILSEDEYLVDAIKRLFYKQVELEKPEVVDGQTDEQLGQKFRAYEASINIINKAFKDLMSYRLDRNKPKKFNKAL